MLAILLVGIGVCLMTMQSYALWVANYVGGENIVEVGCFQIEFEEMSTPISLKNTYPVGDIKGLSGSAYTFKITNKCTIDASYNVTLNTLTTNTLAANQIKYAIHKSTETKPSSGMLISTASINTDRENIPVSNLDTSYIIASGELKAASEANGTGDSVIYSVYLWMDENVGNEGMGKKFEVSVNITTAATVLPTEYDKCVTNYGSDSPQCSIIAQLDTTGACPTVNADGIVNVTSVESTNGYVCSAKDDYGTSYYYRGNVTNNYVKFGGYYWRIIRMNGDGSIRMIYAGDASVIDALDETTKQTVLANGYNDNTTKYTQIGESYFNGSKDNNAYVGYMYGDINGTTYEEVHANNNDSKIKKAVDNWYKAHLFETEYEQYISDTLFCNDRSISSSKPDGYANTGIGQDKTIYHAQDWSNLSFSCKQQNDQFTTKNASFGNRALTYSIGLITKDEVILAGAQAYPSNYKYYLYTGNNYWGMSAYNYFNAEANVFVIHSTGAAHRGYATRLYGVRPVINLKAGSLKSGTGVWNDPYMI